MYSLGAKPLAKKILLRTKNKIVPKKKYEK